MVVDGGEQVIPDATATLGDRAGQGMHKPAFQARQVTLVLHHHPKQAEREKRPAPGRSKKLPEGECNASQQNNLGSGLA